jgi:hypothetical protein
MRFLTKKIAMPLAFLLNSQLVKTKASLAAATAATPAALTKWLHVGLALRFVLLLSGMIYDRVAQVPYTDIDYRWVVCPWVACGGLSVRHFVSVFPFSRTMHSV